MQKIQVLTLGLAAALLLSGCGNDGETASATTSTSTSLPALTTTSPTSATQPTTPPPLIPVGQYFGSFTQVDPSTRMATFKNNCRNTNTYRVDLSSADFSMSNNLERPEAARVDEATFERWLPKAGDIWAFRVTETGKAESLTNGPTDINCED